MDAGANLKIRAAHLTSDARRGRVMGTRGVAMSRYLLDTIKTEILDKINWDDHWPDRLTAHRYAAIAWVAIIAVQTMIKVITSPQYGMEIFHCGM